jgi:cytochrome bd-type quinol oxidase subunit 2
MSEGSIDSRIRKIGFIKGLFLGCIVLSLSIFSYYFITGLAKSPFLAFAGPYCFTIIIPLIVAVLFAFNNRKKLGGYWSFKQAVTGIFIMLFTCFIILTIGRDLVFANFIEPNMVHKTETAMLSNSRLVYEQRGLKKPQIDSLVNERRKEFSTQKTSDAGVFVQGFVITTMLLFVLSVLIGAVVKKDPPIITQV